MVTPGALDVGDWVLVQHENPPTLESKWFGPYQIIEKKVLGTYRPMDPDGRELHNPHTVGTLEAPIRQNIFIRRGVL
jgi:hypothetical protein